MLVSIIIYILARLITRPIYRLANAVNAINVAGKLDTIELPSIGYETSILQLAVNNMILMLERQLEEIKIRDKEIESVSMKEKAVLEEVYSTDADFNGR